MMYIETQVNILTEEEINLDRMGIDTSDADGRWVDAMIHLQTGLILFDDEGMVGIFNAGCEGYTPTELIYSQLRGLLVANRLVLNPNG